MTRGMNRPRVFFVTKVTGFFSVLMVIGAFALTQISIVSIAFGEAVPLIPINTGNPKLNSELPAFYDCIKEAVDNSLSNTEPSYFKEEPTRAEVTGCYESTIVSGASQPTIQPTIQPTSHHKYVASQ